MPIKIQSDLPAKAELEDENIFVMDESSLISGFPCSSHTYSELNANQAGY